MSDDDRAVGYLHDPAPAATSPARDDSVVTVYDADPTLPGAQWPPQTVWYMRWSVGQREERWLQPAPSAELARLWAEATLRAMFGYPPKLKEGPTPASENQVAQWATRVDRATVEASRSGGVIAPPDPAVQAMRASLDLSPPQVASIPRPVYRPRPSWQYWDWAHARHSIRALGALTAWVAIALGPTIARFVFGYTDWVLRWFGVDQCSDFFCAAETLTETVTVNVLGWWALTFLLIVAIQFLWLILWMQLSGPVLDAILTPPTEPPAPLVRHADAPRRSPKLIR